LGIGGFSSIGARLSKKNSCHIVFGCVAMNERFGVGLDGGAAGMRQHETRHFQTKNAMRGGTILGDRYTS
jgi:hypothetical protein